MKEKNKYEVSLNNEPPILIYGTILTREPEGHYIIDEGKIVAFFPYNYSIIITNASGQTD